MAKGLQTQGRLRFLIGPVGAGKTTYACRAIAQRPALLLDLDSAMVRLYGEDPRPAEGVVAWYLQRRERCRGLLWDLAVAAVRAGTDVFLELGLVRRAEREEFYSRAQSDALDFEVYLLDAPREVRRERVQTRNRSDQPFTQIVPDAFFELASDAWEPPTESERKAWSLIDI